MPARTLVCENCGHEVPTFMDDKELEEYPPSCPKCGCPVMKVKAVKASV